ncbi:voltage-gated potassium channel [Natronobacillus azotifigens]|uniref:Potassium channel protein n=1 Tax=Natronobacillus azotifigens TaxID=472978 RepID=A0A9J6RCN7_9BACI|nr:potassium channel protein [Natronobacillus azotifigens]MCZ0703118.1 potassium channel protein [Natronobacillus azotifigens]
MKNRNKIIFFFGLVCALFIIGSLGYWLILDGISWLDAIYMTAITISTVGYGEVAPMSDLAKIFSIALIIFSIGVIGYGGSTVISYIFEGNLKEAWRTRRMNDRIERLTNHYIVCGAGKTGIYVIQTLEARSIPFVVIDNDPDIVNTLKEDDINVIVADATTEDALKKAKIEDAKGLVASLSTDADNLFTVLTARELNYEFTIIAKAINHKSHDKLLRAGANKTVSPNEIGGHRMASMLLRPSVISFLDTVTHAGNLDLDLDEIEITSGSELCDRSIKDANIKEKADLILIALKKANSDEMIFNPNPDEVLEEKDVLIILGKDDQVRALQKESEQE